MGHYKGTIDPLLSMAFNQAINKPQSLKKSLTASRIPLKVEFGVPGEAMEWELSELVVLTNCHWSWLVQSACCDHDANDTMGPAEGLLVASCARSRHLFPKKVSSILPAYRQAQARSISVSLSRRLGCLYVCPHPRGCMHIGKVRRMMALRSPLTHSRRGG